MRGYDSNLISLVNSRDRRDPVVKFAKHCIKNDISVIAIAADFKVSRQAVYNWFKGETTPSAERIEKMQGILAAAKVAAA